MKYYNYCTNIVTDNQLAHYSSQNNNINNNNNIIIIIIIISIIITVQWTFYKPQNNYYVICSKYSPGRGMTYYWHCDVANNRVILNTVSNLIIRI